MKLTLLLIPLIFLSSCTQAITSEIQEAKNQEIQEAKMNQYLTDVARYEAIVRTMDLVKTIDDAGTPYVVYSGTLRWTSCGSSEEGENCTPPGFSMVMRDDVIIWFEESVSALKCATIDTVENPEVIEYIRSTRCTETVSGEITESVQSGKNTTPCMPGMYPNEQGECSAKPPTCLSNQTLTGFVGSQFCID